MPLYPFHTGEESAAGALVQLCASRSAWVGEDVSVALGDAGASVDSVRALEACGAMVTHDGPDGTVLQLRRNRVAWTAHIRLCSPLLVLRESRDDIPLQRRSKMDFILQLQLEGWSDEGNQKLPDWEPEGVLVHDKSWRRPLSYFAALACRFDVLNIVHQLQRLHRQDQLHQEDHQQPEAAFALTGHTGWQSRAPWAVPGRS